MKTIIQKIIIPEEINIQNISISKGRLNVENIKDKVVGFARILKREGSIVAKITLSNNFTNDSQFEFYTNIVENKIVNLKMIAKKYYYHTHEIYN